VKKATTMTTATAPRTRPGAMMESITITTQETASLVGTIAATATRIGTTIQLLMMMVTQLIESICQCLLSMRKKLQTIPGMEAAPKSTCLAASKMRTRSARKRYSLPLQFRSPSTRGSSSQRKPGISANPQVLPLLPLLPQALQASLTIMIMTPIAISTHMTTATTTTMITATTTPMITTIRMSGIIPMTGIIHTIIITLIPQSPT